MIPLTPSEGIIFSPASNLGNDIPESAHAEQVADILTKRNDAPISEMHGHVKRMNTRFHA